MNSNRKRKIDFVKCILGLIFIGFFLDSLNLYYKYLEPYARISLLNDSKMMSQSLTTVIASVTSIIFAVYILLIQVFRNRYPVHFIKVLFKEKMAFISFNYVINVAFGIILTVIEKDLVVSKIIYLGHVLYCLYLFTKMFQDYKIIDVTQLLEKYKQDIIQQFHEEEIDLDQVKKSLHELANYADESFSKSELYVAKNISLIYKDMILYFIENKDKLINRNLPKEDINQLEKFLFVAILNQVKLSVNYEFRNYLSDCFITIEDILIITIKCDKVETFNNFSKKLDNCFKYNVFHKNTFVGVEIIGLYGSIAKYILKNNLRKEWVDLIQRKLYLYRYVSSVYLDDSILKVIFAEHISFIEKAIKENNENVKYEEMINEVINFYMGNVGQCNNNLSNFVQAVLIGHMQMLLEFENKNLIKNFVNETYKMGSSAFANKNRDLCQFILYLFDKLCNEYPDREIFEIISMYKYNLSLEAIYFNSDLSSLFLPNYKNILEHNSSLDTVKDVSSKYKELIYRTMLRKDIESILYFLNEMNDLIKSFSREKKQEQMEFIELYQYLFESSLEINSSETFQIITT